MTSIDVDDLAQIIRQVDGNHDLGAGALAEAILDHLDRTEDEMRWEYAVGTNEGEFLNLNNDAYSGLEIMWTWNRTVAEEVQAECGGTLVRRLAGPVEAV